MEKKRYWLRGGIIGLITNIILTVVGIVVGFSVHDISDAYGNAAEKIFNFFSIILLYSPLSNEGFQFPELFFISLASSFIIGALIGLIYGNNKKYWLRGALAGLVISIAIFTYYLSSETLLCKLKPGGTCPTAWESFVSGFPFSHDAGILFKMLIPIVLIGSVVGLVYGKIKNRKV